MIAAAIAELLPLESILGSPAFAGPDFLKPENLLSVAVEIGRIEPLLQCACRLGPFAVQHREPSRLAVLSLDDHVLAEQAFELHAVAERCPSGCLVVIVAFPFEAPVAEILEDMARGKVEGLGRCGTP